MTLSDRVRSNMDVVLEEICRGLPNGGDHGSRKLIAEQLLEAAEAGQISLADLRIVALHAFKAIIKPH
ncbi:hypothetical protein G8O24_03305 [Bradyrhizobium sp. INPA01-394B]|uniref:Uncharacterized protein n=1 Tax=Bradyrhizobium campsiandrae TaxID=1729892 RepID=A0ABR7U7T0_9BRAD|nr:hypothetical protein [Bradyrhizobium campsiandrae]MBC9876371.1 hypothetical protein [Bradyrhizobium campsiandrae]MBC9980105.1 hypothetical protein [Bradyrhizobium campsiandrae]